MIWLSRVVGAVGYLPCLKDAIVDAARSRAKRSAPPLEFGKFGWRTELCRQLKRVAIVTEQGAEFCFADACGILQHGLYGRLQLTGRRTDDAQHVRRRRLVLQRLAQVV